MADILLSDEQATVLYYILEWWGARRRAPIFTVAGYAGVGKSTVVKYAIEALGLDPVADVAYIAYTGKAALVLRQKGHNACTIHRLIYQPLLSSYIDPYTRLKKTRVSGFEKHQSLEVDYKLFVLDEVSMVPPQLLADLMSFGVPILALGDPGQLPPVMAAPSPLLERPDAFLQQIHRQAADNPIIWASKLAREGRPIPYGKHGEQLTVVKRHQLTLEQKLAADQIICCTHATRVPENNKIRVAKGYEGLPNRGEKLICLKNNWDEYAKETPLVNGLTCRVVFPIQEKHIRRNDRVFDMTVALDGDPSTIFWNLETNLDYFEPLPQRKANTDGEMNHFDYGYVITTYKSQGSEYRNGIYINDAFGSTIERRQHLYTGLTRFSESVVLCL